MGACYVSILLDGNMTKQEVKDHFADAQERSRLEDGNSYSGSIGMARGLEFTPGMGFANYEEADDYLQNYCKKRGPAVCVRYTDAFKKERWMIGAWCAS